MSITLDKFPDPNPTPLLVKDHLYGCEHNVLHSLLRVRSLVDSSSSSFCL